MKVNKTNYSIDPFLSSTLIRGEYKSNGIERKRHLYEVTAMVEQPGHILEFGVYKGGSMSHISRIFPDRTCWGFDSFEGLPEPWFINQGDTNRVYPAGKFNMQDQEWPVFRENVALVRGWFADTLPQWLDQNSGPVAFLHIDCDLYSSTKTILDLLNTRIVPGTVIAFDEFYPWEHSNPYNQWSEHEYRALKEWVENYDREFECMLHTRFQQCSIKVLR